VKRDVEKKPKKRQNDDQKQESRWSKVPLFFFLFFRCRAFHFIFLSSFKKTHTHAVVVKSDDRSALLYTRSLPFSLSLRAPAKEEEEEEGGGEEEEEAHPKRRSKRGSEECPREERERTTTTPVHPTRENDRALRRRRRRRRMVPHRHHQWP